MVPFLGTNKGVDEVYLVKEPSLNERYPSDILPVAQHLDAILWSALERSAAPCAEIDKNIVPVTGARQIYEQ